MTSRGRDRGLTVLPQSSQILYSTLLYSAPQEAQKKNRVRESETGKESHMVDRPLASRHGVPRFALSAF